MSPGETAAYEALLSLSGALQSAMIAALVAAAVIVCTIEIIKIPARALFHWLAFRRWVNSRLANYKRRAGHSETSSEVPLGRIFEYAHGLYKATPGKYSPLTFSLPSDLFLKQVENLSRKALESPASDPSRYLFSAGALRKDFYDTRHSKKIRSNDPRILSQARLADAAERNLDDLQLHIAFWWPTLVRWTAALLGVIFVGWATLIFVGQERIPILVVIIIGLIAGYLAAVINDLVGVLRGWRRSQS
jgi:hypothetical protein